MVKFIYFFYNLIIINCYLILNIIDVKTELNRYE